MHCLEDAEVFYEGTLYIATPVRSSWGVLFRLRLQVLPGELAPR